MTRWNIFIISEKENTHRDNILIEDMLHGTSRSLNQRVANDAYIVGRVKAKNSCHRGTEISESMLLELQYLRLYFSKIYAPESYNQNHLSFRAEVKPISALKTIINCFASAHVVADQTTWDLNAYPNLPMYQGIWSVFKSCSLRLLLLPPNFKTPIETVGIKVGHTMLGPLGNATRRTDSIVCNNDKILSSSEVSNFPRLFSRFTFKFFIASKGNHRELHFPIEINNYANYLRFVSCGQRSKGALPFNEYVAVFNHNVWLCIILTVMCLLRILIIPGETISNAIFSLLKLFLGQGNPFSKNFLRIFSLKLVILPLTFMGVVLSEAYKNTNVYRMIMPSAEIPYEYFSELVADNFSVYSRTFAVRLNPNFWSKRFTTNYNFSLKYVNQDIYFNHIGEAVSEHSSLKLIPYKTDESIP